MRKIDLVYTNLIWLLHNLTLESNSFASFHDTLDEETQNRLIDISEKISSEKKEITKAHLKKEFYPDFSTLSAFINEFSESFADYPGVRKQELLGIITIIQKLTAEYGGAEKLNLDEEIDPNEFEVMELIQDIVQNNFFYFDASDITNSLFLFNHFKTDEFKAYVDSISSGIEVLYYLLSKLGNSQNALKQGKHILVKTQFSNSPKIIWATLCLHIVKTGEIIHASYEYTQAPIVSPTSSLRLGRNYQQFYDSIGIISEYNYQKDILDKYLRIYHVLENFMYKSPLVSLERDFNGEVFSLRDFKRMYDTINDSELAMLKKLFERILALNYDSSQTFNAKVLTEWAALIPTYFPDDTKINLLIKILNIHSNKRSDVLFTDINIATLPHFLAKFVYAFRNSIVHNRETEFHLTHQTLLNHPIISNACLIGIERFLLPVLEQIVFHLIINENDIVWYNNSILKLWDEN